MLADLVTVGAGNVSLSASLSSAKVPTTIAAGSKKNIPLQLTVSNSGTTASAAGTATVAITLHPASGADVTLVTRSVKLPAVKGGKTAKLAAVPVLITSAVPTGSYTLTATVTPSVSALPVLTVTGPTLSVTGGSTPGGGGNVLRHGDTITFTNDGTATGFPSSESGSFTLSDNISGAYQVVFGSIILAFSDNTQDTYVLQASGAQSLLDVADGATGTQYQADTTAASATFHLVASSSNGHSGFLHRVG